MLNRLKQRSPPSADARRDRAVRRLVAAVRTLVGAVCLAFALSVFFRASVWLGVGLTVSGGGFVAGIWLARRPLRQRRMTFRDAAKTVPLFATILFGDLAAAGLLLRIDDPAKTLAGPAVDVAALVLAIITLLLVLFHDRFPTTERPWISVLEGVLCVGAILLGTLAAAHGTHESQRSATRSSRSSGSPGTASGRTSVTSGDVARRRSPSASRPTSHSA
jgi:uncharacterized membrane protein